MNHKVGINRARPILWILALLFFSLAALLLFRDKTASGSAAAGIAVLILCLANLDHIESFKGFGVEAKTRDLRQAIEDAESTLVKLEEMSAQLNSQAASIQVLHTQLDETNTMARRAQDLVHQSQGYI